VTGVNGPKRLLLVHGFGGSREDFTEWLPRLEDHGWECLAPQLPGHGDTHGPGNGHGETPERYGLQPFAHFVLDVADANRWDRFVLLGHSMGGMVAQLVALQQPHRLDGLILMGTGHGPVDLDADLLEAGKALVRNGGMPALVEAVRGQPDTPAHERLLKQRIGYAEFMEAKALAMDPRMWLTLVDEFTTQPDRLDALRHLDVPALVIAGEQDDRFLEPCRRLAAALPNACLAVIADAGHSPQFEAPAAWWDAVCAFLSALA
jgi:pimeloyl-ACP methyl ester carboxylesterase